MGAAEQQVGEEGQPAAAAQPHAPWMSNRKKSRGTLRKQRARAADRINKQAAREAQQQAAAEEAAAERATAEDADEPGGGGGGSGGGGGGCVLDTTRGVFTAPSAARALLFRRGDQLRRRCARGPPRGGRGERPAWLRRMQCPFVWDLDAVHKCVSMVELYRRLDSAPYRPTPWHVAVDQIYLAYEFARVVKHRGQDLAWKSRELLEEVYALLAAQDRLQKRARDALLHKYRAGLKHVLDCCWLLVREDQHARRGLPLPDGTLPAQVRDFESLDEKQKAAVWAVRAMMVQDKGITEFADKALELDSGEGQWYYVRASCERSRRARRLSVDEMDELEPAVTDNELLLFQKAYDRRKNPQTVMRMAQCYLAREDHKRCVDLLREALEMFRLSAYVQLKSGHIYLSLNRGKKDKKLAGICLAQAVHLAQSWRRAKSEYFCYQMSEWF